jgi:hypothetical protein
MAEGDGAFYNKFKEDCWEKLHDLADDTITITLHTAYTPDIDAHTVWADVSATEYGTADGYTAGGEVLANADVTVDNANDRAVFDADDVTWSSLGALTPDTPSHAIIWNDSAASDELVCYITLGTTATDGNDYVLLFGANGIGLLT